MGLLIQKTRARKTCTALPTSYISGMLLFTCQGPRSFDARDVLHVYRGEKLGRYVQVTAVLANGDQASGLMHAEASEDQKAK